MLNSIYVINLDNNKERLETVEKTFKENNLSFKRFSAIYGKNLNEQEIKEKTEPICNTLLCTKGMIGCALSHIQLWKQLANDNVDYYIIMEDDVKLNKDFVNTIKEIENSNIDFDFLYLRCMSVINCQHKNVIKTLSNGYQIGESYFPLTNASYILSKKGAEKLMNLIDKVSYHIDVVLAIKQYSNDLKIYTLNPNLVELSEDSDNSTLLGVNIKSPTLKLANAINSKLYWYLNIPIFCIQMKFIINAFLIFLLLLLFINYKYIKSKILYIYIFVELFIYFLL